jgi:hypothetical protein
MGLMDGKNGASDQAAAARKDEMQRQNRIRVGTRRINDTFGQFDDGFYDDISSSYRDFAQPDLDRQFGDATEKLTFSLARNGMLNSSTRAEQSADLQGDYDKAKVDLESKAKEYATGARNSVEDARTDLISTLQLTGDAVGASNAAVNRATALATPPTYSPIAQLFTDFTNGLAQQAALERAEAYSGGAVRPRFNTGLFGTNSGAVKVGG